MDQFLKSLRHRRAGIQARVGEEQSHLATDHLRLTVLNKLRLMFREQIEFIERVNRNGEVVPIPVVRRRSFRSVLSERA